ncbi:alpha/beta hydrolase family protein [Ottowia pentelensis]|uniref:alpha/beta hydrolase family protein n=1 Tax=Ottowia pentelensis TaxID=511108 RepID=UPI0036381D82
MASDHNRAMRPARSPRPGAVTRVQVCCRLALVALTGASAPSAWAATPYPAGMTQVEYVDAASGQRTLSYMLIYPAAPADGAEPFRMPMTEGLRLYLDAPAVPDGPRHPLVVLSHGAGGNGSNYAWLGQYLAARGYIVALVHHYRANTYDRSALYVRNRLWQRPRDISLDISHLLQDPVWGPRIDPGRIGAAGHSQGVLPRCGWAAPRLTPRPSCAISAAGRTTPWCLRTSARACRLTRRPRSICATSG